MRKLAASLLLCSVSLPAWALSDPSATPKDPHVRTEQYDPSNRTLLVLQFGGVTNITFDPMEIVETVVRPGNAPFDYPHDDKGQQNAPSNNIQLVGQKAGTGSLTVVTRHAPPNDEEHVYNFSVKVVPAPSDGSDDPTVTYQLTFTYPPGAKPTRAAQVSADAEPVARDVPDPPKRLTWKEKKAQQDMAIMAARMEADPMVGPQNENYIAMGRDRNIAPLGASDNYRSTGFRYPGNMPQPSVFKVMDGVQGTPPICQGRRPTGAELDAPEQAVNTLVRGEQLVVQETWPHWRLRSGEAVVDVWNCNYNAVGYDPGTGTDSSDLVRRVLR